MTGIPHSSVSRTAKHMSLARSACAAHHADRSLWLCGPPFRRLEDMHAYIQHYPFSICHTSYRIAIPPYTATKHVRQLLASLSAAQVPRPDSLCSHTRSPRFVMRDTPSLPSQLSPTPTISLALHAFDPSDIFGCSLTALDTCGSRCRNTRQTPAKRGSSPHHAAARPIRTTQLHEVSTACGSCSQLLVPGFKRCANPAEPAPLGRDPLPSDFSRNVSLFCALVRVVHR